MTGKEILEALSFVDESYIDEAENGKIRNKHQLKKLLPMAACFCLILCALIAAHQNHRTSMHVCVLPPENPVEIPESAVYGDVGVPDTAPEPGSTPMLDAEAVPNISEVPSVILTVKEWTDHGFTALVSGYVDAECIPLGTLIRVEKLPSICVEVYEGDIVSVQRRIPTEADFPAGTRIRVQFTEYSVEENTLYIDCIFREGD